MRYAKLLEMPKPVDIRPLELLIEKLKRTQFGLDSVLAITVPQRIAYHHAGKKIIKTLILGLIAEEREILEEGKLVLFYIKYRFPSRTVVNSVRYFNSGIRCQFTS